MQANPRQLLFSLKADRDLRDADDQSTATGEFVLVDFRGEFYVRAELLKEGAGGVIEEVNNIASEAVLEAAAFVEVERAYRIDFHVARLAHSGTQLALEFEGTLPHLGHGKSYDVISHRIRQSADRLWLLAPSSDEPVRE
jgi:hypothetical protein